MGQQEKARTLVENAYEFTMNSTKSAKEVSQSALEAADRSGGGLRGKVENVGGHKGEDGSFTSFFIIKGPGGFVDIMGFSVTADPRADGGSAVSLSVGDFTFQKGSLGMKPTINGRTVIAKYVTLLKASL